jgi:hypothetical protein
MVRHSLSRLAPVGVLAALLLLVPGPPITAQKASRFASLIANLSEPGGYFDTDNLISNERSYLQVIPDLRQARLAGGAYIGVGPDTNFSYIAEVRPAIAFIIDVRRDNLLLHLLFKAIFELSGTRAEYLSLLLGRPPVHAGDWRDAPIDRLVAHFDRAIPARDDTADRKRRIEEAIDRTGVPLSAQDRATISRFHQRFIDAGLELRFNTLGRAPQANYPTYRDLLLETDAAGQQGSFLASEAAFQFVKSLQERDLVIPVVGDLSGPSALSAIGRTLSSRRHRLTTFYTSNVEFYLYGQGTFPKFVASLTRIPRSSRSVVIRSIFGRPWMGRPGDSSTSQLQLVSDLVKGHAEGRFKTYGQLVTEK